jgi:hypothetical protein
VLIRLEPELLERLDEASRAGRQTRNRWVAALLRRTLLGKSDLPRTDQTQLVAMLKDLRRIEADTARSAQALSDLAQAARRASDRLQEVERFQAQVAAMGQALEERLRGQDADWRALLGPERGGET